MQSARLLGPLRLPIFLLLVPLPTVPTSTFFAFSPSTQTLGIQTSIITRQKETT
ncbi:hypothetical protein CKAH01_06696 [Colletotrichum kahawae]|uniref:Uncharacterized protein n=1 Tax=Colletotrichum kahawae TaxID=34407 RepID=A0AAE0D295_COLKA|nr:hypothetical protein CKAH01_06696 [Colletotrichum kahawae]